MLFDRAADDGSMMNTSGPVENVSYCAPKMTRSSAYINDKINILSFRLMLFEMVHQMMTQSERAHKFDQIRNCLLD